MAKSLVTTFKLSRLHKKVGLEKIPIYGSGLVFFISGPIKKSVNLKLIIDNLEIIISQIKTAIFF